MKSDDACASAFPNLRMEQSKQARITQPKVTVCLSIFFILLFALVFYIANPLIFSATAYIPHNDTVAFMMNINISMIKQDAKSLTTTCPKLQRKQFPKQLLHGYYNYTL